MASLFWIGGDLELITTFDWSFLISRELGLVSVILLKSNFLFCSHFSFLFFYLPQLVKIKPTVVDTIVSLPVLRLLEPTLRGSHDPTTFEIYLITG